MIVTSAEKSLARRFRKVSLSLNDTFNYDDSGDKSV